MNNENFDLTIDNNDEEFDIAIDNNDEEFAVEFGEVINDGGTRNYERLINKPQINGVTLSGNKTNSELGIPTKTSQLTNDSGFLTAERDPTVPQYVKNITQSNINSWNNKSDFSGDYNDLTNKPTIPTVNNAVLTIQKNGVDVQSFTANSSINKTANITVPTGTKDLANDAGFITSSYHDSTKQDVEDNALETNNKTVVGAINEVDSIAKGANQALSFVNYSTMVTEFNSLDSDEYNVGQNIYIQTVDVPDLWISNVESTSSTYTYVDDATIISALGTNGYVQVGYYKLSALETQKVDLTNYVTTTDYASNATGGVIRTSTSYGTTVSGSGVLNASTLPYETYTEANNTTFVGKGTLENVITGKGLVSNTDYASSGVGGVIKTSASYGTSKTTSGVLNCLTKSYGDYTDAGNYLFVSKGTLENVITGKGLVDQTALAGKQDTLTAGTGINITNNVISATGGGVGNNVFYGTCATDASTAAKVVVCEDFTASELVAGTRLTVLFTNANSYNGTSTLNVNNTGAKDIYYNGTTNNARYMWVAGESVEFVYNGTQWATVNGGLATTTYYGVTKLTSSASTDSQSVALTPRALYYFANYSIAPFYSTSSTYAVGDKVRYSYYLYECITAIETPEAWTAEHWQQVDTLQEQIDALEARIRALENSQ